MKPPLIIYHGSCPDGFCAAWIAHRALSDEGIDPELYPAKYAEPAPHWKKLQDREVYILDFSYPREVMEAIRARASKLQVIDHHQTAQKNLEGLEGCIFDMNESGASLAWDFFFPEEPRPWVVEYVKDRDLWRWKLSHSKEIAAYMMALDQTLEAWDELAATDLSDVAMMGTAIRMHIEEYIRRTKEHSFLIRLDGQPMRCVNAPYMNISDLLHELCDENYPVSLGFFWRGNQWQYSMRSINGTPCAPYAERRGGGGHLDAAGFESKDLLPEIQAALTELAHGHRP